MKSIQKSDLRPVDYAEYGSILDVLTQKVVAAGVKYDLIVPILRSGAFTGLHLASKLHLTNILPAQYKSNAQVDGGLIKKFDFPKLHFEVPINAQILVVDSNSVTGLASGKVIEDLKAAYPSSDIDFASACLDQSLVNAPFARDVFYGVLSNERRLLTVQDAEARHISRDLLIFPWEDLEEQWAEIQSQQPKPEFNNQEKRQL